MEMNARPDWNNLPEAIRNEWINSVMNFYPAGTTTREDAVNLAKDDYENSETLQPEAFPVAV